MFMFVDRYSADMSAENRSTYRSTYRPRVSTDTRSTDALSTHDPGRVENFQNDYSYLLIANCTRGRAISYTNKHMVPRIFERKLEADLLAPPLLSPPLLTSSLQMSGAPNENIVQNHLNIPLLNLFWYLKGRYRHIFIP